MIFNESFAIGEQYVANTGEIFRVVDVKTHPTLGFPSGNTAVSYFAGYLPERFCESGFPPPRGCP